MSSFYKLISGFIIGICAASPGISGTVISIMLGIYDYVIDVFNSKKNIIKKIYDVFFIGVGVILGIFIFGKIMYIVFEKYEIIVKYTFIGIILGSTLVLNNEIVMKCNRNLSIKYFFISLLLSIILFVLPKYFSNYNSDITNVKLFIGGILYISGKVVPGVSSSIFMMILGLYDYVLLFFNKPITFLIMYYIKLIPFICGIIIGLIIFLKLMNFLLKKYFVNTYSIIIGLVFGSIIAVYPGFVFNKLYIIALITMIISFSLTYLLCRKN